MKLAHIDQNNIVTNIVAVDPASTPDWCSGWPEANQATKIGDSYDPATQTFTPPPAPPAPPPSTDDVNRERDRRLAGTFTFQARVFDCDQKSLARITGAATLAGFAIAAGAQPDDYYWHGGTSAFIWITADNAMVFMDAHTVLALGKAAAANETAHIFAARALKDQTPIPADFAADQHWP